MKAMILAAGFGKRMAPLTNDTPKALIPFHGKPIIEHILSTLPEISLLVVNAHHLAEKISGYFSSRDFSYPVRISLEKEILGTGGGLFQALPMLTDDDFLLVNCDIVCRPDYQALLSAVAKNEADITLLVSNRYESSRLVFDKNGQLAGLEANGHIKWSVKEPPPTEYHVKAFCGIAYFSRKGGRAFLESNCRQFSIIDSYLHLAQKGCRVLMHDITGTEWIDLGTREKLEEQEKNYK